MNKLKLSLIASANWKFANILIFKQIITLTKHCLEDQFHFFRISDLKKDLSGDGINRVTQFLVIINNWKKPFPPTFLIFNQQQFENAFYCSNTLNNIEKSVNQKCFISRWFCSIIQKDGFIFQ